MEETSTDKITEHLGLTYSLDSDIVWSLIEEGMDGVLLYCAPGQGISGT